MQISIDLDADLAVFQQLIDQIKQAVQKGTLLPGTALPSIRQLANDLEINNKTVAKAYKMLERDAVIQTRGYRGTIVHPDAQQNCAIDLKQWSLESLSEVIARLRAASVTDSEIRIAFSQAMNSSQTQRSVS